MLLSGSNFPKIALPLLNKKVFKMLFWKSKIIWKRSWSLVLSIFRNLWFKVGQFQPSVAYKSVAYKNKKNINIFTSYRHMSFRHQSSRCYRNKKMSHRCLCILRYRHNHQFQWCIRQRLEQETKIMVSIL